MAETTTYVHPDNRDTKVELTAEQAVPFLRNGFAPQEKPAKKKTAAVAKKDSDKSKEK